QSISGSSVSMNTFNGKKILIAVFNPLSPNTMLLYFLDSLCTANGSMKIIAAPGKEFGNAPTTTSLVSLAQRFSTNFLMMQPVHVKKSSGANQNVLFNWLTHVTENGHFDNETNTAGQIFII